jgi:ribosomal protein L11 methyltransferase
VGNVKDWPALDVAGTDSDFLLATLDDHAPTAIEERASAVRVFFSTVEARDRALADLASGGTAAAPVDVPDEDWARRSQQNITPITVGRITIAPPWAVPAPPALPALVTIVIQPSMGFGTGHHATTRLCLRALQSIEPALAGADVLDVGTGSGVLAIAACRLGARRAVGIDHDVDAIRSANENLQLNSDAGDARFELVDLSVWLDRPRADIVTANLTGAVLERAAASILSATRPGGTMILSGLLTPERPSVQAAFGAARLVDAFEEDGWAALILKKM